jgi:outer membrane protein assembly factor BamB
MIRITALALCLSSSLFAQHDTKPLFWPEKGGPTANGMVPDTENIPLSWNEAKGENVAWKTPLTGSGHSTPVIGGDLIWFTSATMDGKQQFVDCIHRISGKIIHHKLLWENSTPEELGNPINNYAAPTPVLEADAIYVHFGTYGTARLDPQTAEIVWKRRDINARHFRGPGSSPFIHEELLYLTFDGIDQQYITALDKKTGTTVWKTQRTTDYGDIDAATGQPKRDGDFRKAYHTPSIVKVGDALHLVSIGSKAGFGYDPKTGKELWTIRHTNMNAAPRVVATADVMAFSSGAESAHLIGVRLDGKMSGDITESHVIWDRQKRNCSEASPILIDGHVYQTTRGGVISCVNITNGQDLWEERLDGQHLPGPIATKDRIYFANDRGQVSVVKASPKFERLALNELAGGADDACTAGMAVADGALFIRTKTHLVKITEKK